MDLDEVTLIISFFNILQEQIFDLHKHYIIAYKKEGYTNKNNSIIKRKIPRSSLC